jgi:hypothetical protein
MSALSQFFLNPAFFLPGAALVLLPILIHILSRLRYRTVRFAAMEFLLASEELNRRRLILEQLLQLLLRILAVLLFVLLIARLLLDPGRLLMLRGASAHHVVLLDDSLSMRDQEGDQPLFQAALATLETMLVEGSRQGGAARVTILGLSDPGRPIVSDRVLDGAFVQEFMPRLRNQPCSFRPALLAESLQTAKDILAADGSVSPQVHVLTDFRAVDWNNRPEVLSAIEALGTIRAGVDIVRIGRDARSNIAIRELSAESLGAARAVPWRLSAVIRNHGSARATDLRATVLVDGVSQPGRMLIPDIEPGTEVVVPHDLSFETEGRHLVEVRLEPDPLAEDNRRLLAVEVAERRTVLIVDDEGAQEDAGFVSAALAADPGLTGLSTTIRTSQTLTAADLQSSDCVYLLNVREQPADVVLQLADFVRRGGGIVWFPGEQASVQWYSETLRKPGQKLFPIPLGVLQTAAAPAADLLAPEQPPFLTPVFETHPVFSVYNAPDSPFPDTVQVSRWFQPASDWKPDDTERADGVRTLMRLRNGDPVAFEHSLGSGRILTFLTGAGRRWSNWPAAPASPGYVVMHLLMHQYLQRPVADIEMRELVEPFSLRWSADEWTDGVEVYLPEAGPGEEPVAETFLRLRAGQPESPREAAASAAAEAAEPAATPTGGSGAAAQQPGTVAGSELQLFVPQARRPGMYRIRRFRPDGAVGDLAVVLNVPASESALAIADPAPLTTGADRSHVAVITGDDAAALGGSGAGRELRWVLLGLLAAVLVCEQLISLKLSYHPEAGR